MHGNDLTQEINFSQVTESQPQRDGPKWSNLRWLPLCSTSSEEKAPDVVLEAPDVVLEGSGDKLEGSGDKLEDLGDKEESEGL